MPSNHDEDGGIGLFWAIVLLVLLVFGMAIKRHREREEG